MREGGGEEWEMYIPDGGGSCSRVFVGGRG